jgi:hypothetical protein
MRLLRPDLASPEDGRDDPMASAPYTMARPSAVRYPTLALPPPGRLRRASLGFALPFVAIGTTFVDTA